VPELAVNLIVDDEDIIREVLKEALESGRFTIIAGLGIARIFDLVARARVASGELVRVLPQADGGGPPVHALALGQTHDAYDSCGSRSLGGSLVAVIVWLADARFCAKRLGSGQARLGK
jgi:hypothetical protein